MGAMVIYENVLQPFLSRTEKHIDDGLGELQEASVEVAGLARKRLSTAGADLATFVRERGQTFLQQHRSSSAPAGTGLGEMPPPPPRSCSQPGEQPGQEPPGDTRKARKRR